MKMKSWERLEQPHCVYRLYDAGDVLLYIGCSMNPWGRQQVLSLQSWWQGVTTIRLKWYGSWHAGRTAEMEAIVAEHPRHNKLVHPPASVGMNMAATANASRGDGFHCPKCGEPKADRKHAYCTQCTAAYQAARREVAKNSLAKSRTTPSPLDKCGD